MTPGTSCPLQPPLICVSPLDLAAVAALQEQGIPDATKEDVARQMTADAERDAAADRTTDAEKDVAAGLAADAVQVAAVDLTTDAEQEVATSEPALSSEVCPPPLMPAHHAPRAHVPSVEKVKLATLAPHASSACAASVPCSSTRHLNC